MSSTRLEAEFALVRRLQSGDAEAFTGLVDDLHSRLTALARTFTRSDALAEDIVQETWLGVIRGLHQFEGRSTLRTWIHSILVKRARTMTAREARRLWEEAPVPREFDDPATAFQTKEALEVIRRALQALPHRQRQAILLRDVEDLPPSEVCTILEITEANLRVLLHRGRSSVRRALDRYVRHEVVQFAGLPAEALTAARH